MGSINHSIFGYPLNQHVVIPNFVNTVFGRFGDVVARTGDYTAVQVGADPAGTAAAALSAHVLDYDPHNQYVLKIDLESYLDAAIIAYDTAVNL